MSTVRSTSIVGWLIFLLILVASPFWPKPTHAQQTDPDIVIKVEATRTTSWNMWRQSEQESWDVTPNQNDHPDIAEVQRVSFGITVRGLKPGTALIPFTYTQKTIQRQGTQDRVVYERHRSHFKIIVSEAGTETGGGCFEPASSSALANGNFGAIAAAVSRIGVLSGVACNAATKEEAERKALQACNSSHVVASAPNSATTCKVVASVKDSYAALAIGLGREYGEYLVGHASGNSREDAEKKALEGCGGQCQIRYSISTAPKTTTADGPKNPAADTPTGGGTTGGAGGGAGKPTGGGGGGGGDKGTPGGGKDAGGDEAGDWPAPAPETATLTVIMKTGTSRTATFKSQVARVTVASSSPSIADANYSEDRGVTISGASEGDATVTVSGEIVRYLTGIPDKAKGQRVNSVPLQQNVPFNYTYKVKVVSDKPDAKSLKESVRLIVGGVKAKAFDGMTVVPPPNNSNATTVSVETQADGIRIKGEKLGEAVVTVRLKGQGKDTASYVYTFNVSVVGDAREDVYWRARQTLLRVKKDMEDYRAYVEKSMVGSEILCIWDPSFRTITKEGLNKEFGFDEKIAGIQRSIDSLDNAHADWGAKKLSLNDLNQQCFTAVRSGVQVLWQLHLAAAGGQCFRDRANGGLLGVPKAKIRRLEEKLAKEQEQQLKAADADKISGAELDRLRQQIAAAQDEARKNLFKEVGGGYAELSKLLNGRRRFWAGELWRWYDFAANTDTKNDFKASIYNLFSFKEGVNDGDVYFFAYGIDSPDRLITGYQGSWCQQLFPELQWTDTPCVLRMKALGVVPVEDLNPVNQAAATNPTDANARGEGARTPQRSEVLSSFETGRP